MAAKYPTRKGCTGNPKCLTDAGAAMKWRDEVIAHAKWETRHATDYPKIETKLQREWRNHYEIGDYIIRLNTDWDGEL
jgi:hypothetical protein